MTMKYALICVDNLRIGGYQRLSLDEAYALSDRDFKVLIFVLEKNDFGSTKGKTLLEIENELISRKNITVHFSSHRWLTLFWDMYRQINTLSVRPIVISHSLRCTVALRLLKLFARKRKIIINTKVHQIPSLTDPKQRLKRFFYTQFTDRLFGFSEAVRISWTVQFGSVFKPVLRFSKRIELLRNGIYLERLPLRGPFGVDSSSRPRIIFLGRLTFWKGLEIFEKLSELDSLKDFDFLFVVPNYNKTDFLQLQKVLGGRLQIVVGKSVNELGFFDGDVHLYPTQYGASSKVTESISLNCLEMAGMGIPSVITEGGQITWTEGVFKRIFLEVDWFNNIEVVNQIYRASREVIPVQELMEIRNLINIDRELDSIIQN